MKFHVFCSPENVADKTISICAFTRKSLLFCDILKNLGHEVIYYGREGGVVNCDKFEVIMTDKDIFKFWPNNSKHDIRFTTCWDRNTEFWKLANKNSIELLKKNVKRGDFICTVAGNVHEVFCTQFPHNAVVEYGIGYTGIFAKYKVFESYSHMHYMYGFYKIPGMLGDPCDTAIPNFYDPSMFPSPTRPRGYLVYVGRLIHNKGVQEAADVATKLGKQLYVIGPGVKEYRENEYIRTIKIPTDKNTFVVKGNVKYLGVITNEERNKIVSEADALMCPTKYLGPFEGTHAEANLCGVPCITTDFGVFTETVINGFNGYRCSTVDEMVEAVKKSSNLNRNIIKEYAMSRFSTDAVTPLYKNYFNRIKRLRGEVER
jgi:glycosyltransferase involved in cell wall biosynthesis